TRFSRDWSSDVCSSDLHGHVVELRSTAGRARLYDAPLLLDEFSFSSFLCTSLRPSELTSLPFLSIPFHFIWFLFNSFSSFGCSQIGRASVGKRFRGRWS